MRWKRKLTGSRKGTTHVQSQGCIIHAWVTAHVWDKEVRGLRHMGEARKAACGGRDNAQQTGSLGARGGQDGSKVGLSGWMRLTMTPPMELEDEEGREGREGPGPGQRGPVLCQGRPIRGQNGSHHYEEGEQACQPVDEGKRTAGRVSLAMCLGLSSRLRRGLAWFLSSASKTWTASLSCAFFSLSSRFSMADMAGEREGEGEGRTGWMSGDRGQQSARVSRKRWRSVWSPARGGPSEAWSRVENATARHLPALPAGSIAASTAREKQASQFGG